MLNKALIITIMSALLGITIQQYGGDDTLVKLLNKIEVTTLTGLRFAGDDADEATKCPGCKAPRE